MKTLMVTTVFTVVVATALQAEGTAIGYPTYEAALEALKKRNDTKVTVKLGWTIVKQRGENNFLVLWSFTPKGHYAHPAAVKRTVERDSSGNVYIQMAAICGAAKSSCDKLMQQFRQLNQNIKNDLKKK